MDRAKNYFETFASVEGEEFESQVSELTDSQLALVGGGNGDPILH